MAMPLDVSLGGQWKDSAYLGVSARLSVLSSLFRRDAVVLTALEGCVIVFAAAEGDSGRLKMPLPNTRYLWG